MKLKAVVFVVCRNVLKSFKSYDKKSSKQHNTPSAPVVIILYNWC